MNDLHEWVEEPNGCSALPMTRWTCSKCGWSLGGGHSPPSANAKFRRSGIDLTCSELISFDVHHE